MRLGLLLYARQVKVTGSSTMPGSVPLLLAVNHPNSFLDAIVVAVYANQPITFFARGDVFTKPWIRGLLRQLNMVPIYRIRDGKDKLELNDASFEQGVQVLQQGGTVLVFVEGFCAHQTNLQLPLKKGAPRMLQRCWQIQVPAQVLPVWVQYSSFNRLGKTIHIRFGQPFGQPLAASSAAAEIVQVNTLTARALQQLHQASPFTHARMPSLWRWLLALPALLGAVLHAPLYLPVQAVVRRLTRNTVHYDAALFASLLLLYPLYLLLATISMLALITTTAALLLPLAMPVLAYAYIKWRTDD